MVPPARQCNININDTPSWGSVFPTMTELEINGVISTDSTEIANTFNNYFIQSVEELAETFEPVKLPQVTETDSLQSFYIKEVDQEKVGKIINKLSNSKAKDVFGLDIVLINQ